MFDLLLRRARLTDDTLTDIAIQDGKIAAVGDITAAARKTVELNGEVFVSAGWIDSHVHCYPNSPIYHDEPDSVGIATGVTSSLLSRAADVALKERRPLVLMIRETPLHLGHLRTMVRLAEMGAVLAPPLPAFYAKPATIEEMVDQSVGRALDLFGLSWKPVKRWGRDVGPLKTEA